MLKNLEILDESRGVEFHTDVVKSLMLDEFSVDVQFLVRFVGFIQERFIERLEEFRRLQIAPDTMAWMNLTKAVDNACKIKSSLSVVKQGDIFLWRMEVIHTDAHIVENMLNAFRDYAHKKAYSYNYAHPDQEKEMPIYAALMDAL